MRVLNINERIAVGGMDAWDHIWDCICIELGIEEF